MTPEQIIRKTVSTDGLAIDREDLIEHVLDRMNMCHIFQYGNALFTVDKELPFVHLCSDSSDRPVKAIRTFMRDVWSTITTNYILAPIRNERIKRIALKMGWIHCYNQAGFEIFIYHRRM